MKTYVLTSAVVFLGLASAHDSPARKRTSIVPRQFSPADPYANWPSYSQLPLNSSYPTAAAWGVWGADDVYGALNHITSATILAATQEIQLGRTINLNLEVGRFVNPINPSRKPLTHLYQPGDGYIDDVVMLNTQITTQYDGLRHYPYSTNASIDTYRWYNDLIADYDEVIGSAPTAVLGIQQVAQRGIAGRGVLLDWAGYAEANNITYDAFEDRGISTSEWDAVAAWQGLPANWSRPGDILVTRTGWIKKFNALNATAAATLPWVGAGEAIGFLADDESAEWLWDKKLALVGADNPAFESLPLNKTIGGVPSSLHQVFLAGWGQSILEYLDLETLAETLHSLNRSTFFLTIQNLNILSGVASPPNALAII